MAWTANLYLAQQVKDEQEARQKTKRDAQLVTVQHCLDMKLEVEAIREILACLGLDRNEL